VLSVAAMAEPAWDQHELGGA